MLIVVALVIPASRPTDAEGWWRAVSLTWIYDLEPAREAMLHTWSLATELSWYVALPFMEGGGQARSPAQRVASLWICASLISRRSRSRSGGVSGPRTPTSRALTYPYWLPAFLFCFAGGALVALLAEARRAHIVTLRGLARCALTGGRPWCSPWRW